MKTTKQKRLVLARETLRAIGVDTLKNVGGGASDIFTCPSVAPPNPYLQSYTCENVCRTTKCFTNTCFNC